MTRSQPLLSVEDLRVEFPTEEGVVRAVDGISYQLEAGQVLGLVGESGCGKTVSVLALLGLLDPPGRVVAGRAVFGGRDLLRLSRRQLRRVRGKEIAMIFQDPMTALTPSLTAGHQVAEALMAHDPAMTSRAARRRALELLELVGVPRPESRYHDYPFQWSGGMRQRAMIAMAIANRPRLLIADEPTTALDVTIQAQILDLLRIIQEETGTAIMIISHDLGVIAEMADRVAVMYAGRIVETGTATDVFRLPRHPYTLGLLASLPRLQVDLERLVAIPGQPPSLIDPPEGCPFHPRCRMSRERVRCRVEVPPLEATDRRAHLSACHFWEETEVELARVSEEMGADVPGTAG